MRILLCLFFLTSITVSAGDNDHTLQRKKLGNSPFSLKVPKDFEHKFSFDGLGNSNSTIIYLRVQKNPEDYKNDLINSGNFELVEENGKKDSKSYILKRKDESGISYVYLCIAKNESYSITGNSSDLQNADLLLKALKSLEY